MGVQPYEDKRTVIKLTISPSAVSANTTAEQTFTITGVKAGKHMVDAVNKPTGQAGLGIVGFRVSADNQIGITFLNSTGSPITPTAGEVYLVKIFHPEKSFTAIP